jgi:hypothetical protein
MFLIGVPDHVDPVTERSTSEWRLSTRTIRELARRDEIASVARYALSALSDQELRVRVAAELDDTILELGAGEDIPGFPDAATMSRDEMLDFLAEGAVAGFDPDIEVVYPGAADPTAD